MGLGFIDNWLGFDSNPDTSAADKASREAKELQERMYEETVARQQPFLDVGTAGIGQLGERLGVSGDSGSDIYGSLMGGYSPEQLTEDPSYQFRLDEGLKAQERALASQGKTMSPEAVKALTGYGQNMASQEYGRAFDRNRATQGDIYNRLAGITGTGQTASQGLTSAGQNFAAQQGQTGASLANVKMAADQGQQARRDSMFSNLAQGAMMFSDRTLKENIVKVGEQNGHNIYHFNYIGRPERFEGVMAQEVQKTNPEAVGTLNGKLAVNYDMLGLEMKEL